MRYSPGLIASVAGAATLWLTIGASAQDNSQRERQALNNLQHEMTTCVAYFAITRQCVLNRNRPEEDAQLVQQASAAYDRLLKEAISIGNVIGITPDAMVSRLHNQTTIMKALINDDCINVASLLSRHGMRCKQVAENPDSVLIEYTNEDR
jgi:hypothetical protein